jgi:hypothetical protein
VRGAWYWNFLRRKVVGEKKRLNAEKFFFLYKISGLPFTVVMSSLRYCLIKRAETGFSKFLNKTGISSGKTS